MIYLKPIGGLCNRMRTIDSVLAICLENNQDLTILWVKDFSLNCSFHEIFEKLEVEGIVIKVLDCPIGYPENFMKNPNLFGHYTDRGNFMNFYFIKILKNLRSGRFLNKELKHIKRILRNLNSENILTNEQLADLYSSERHSNNKSTREMDEDFIPLAKPLVQEISNVGSCYISSCYRLFPLQDKYDFFEPLESIRIKIDSITLNFNDIIGLHIRRSDHSTSKAFSTTEKFIEIVKSELLKNPNCTFFLSTDDAVTKKNLLNTFGNKIIFNEVSSYDRNNPDAVKDAVVDLYCLSKTKKIYGSHHSSFSQTAADIGGVEEITAR